MPGDRIRGTRHAIVGGDGCRLRLLGDTWGFADYDGDTASLPRRVPGE